MALKTDISTLTADDLRNIDGQRIHLWLLSPACQPYTVLNPSAKGAQDPRAQSFLHLVTRVLPQLAERNDHPRCLLVENVAGFESSSTRTTLVDTLRNLGYETRELLLTPLQFGVPNSRLRYYLLAKLRTTSPPPQITDHSAVLRHIPGLGEDWVDPRSIDQNNGPLGEAQPAEGSKVHALCRYLNTDGMEACTIPDRVLQKWGRLFDIVLPSSTRSCCFTRGYTQLVESAGSILQMNETLDTTAIFDEFLSAQENGDPDAVRILNSLRLRYFHPDELLRLFGFRRPVPMMEGEKNNGSAGVEDAEDFRWPVDLSMKTKYRLIGNSINIVVVSELIRYLFSDWYPKA
ncbi:S-adenosyl-L-methionine-dependent methyltransferase [Punctularia strigosozonata HHB-11173 SS5]|uniref:S-adenosyl-L-methionine-dependent methyltransferase n=1 Tax=Punctularia strigosozonata (strain HHB-11173) TaxID=741275 RepID=UPI00044173AE|nr:S-adenosyl-L-methionine-dependent methyltransferase [Punctularia strigosozonata HHB-11173 SS5]EIN13227.1 S-adenosyl-L-methionine-dependent methyltransferase [Punctularia strigosozonata HHB-11173 SS5]